MGSNVSVTVTYPVRSMGSDVSVQIDSNLAQGRKSSVECGECYRLAAVLLALMFPFNSMGPGVSVESGNAFTY